MVSFGSNFQFYFGFFWTFGELKDEIGFFGKDDFDYVVILVSFEFLRDWNRNDEIEFYLWNADPIPTRVKNLWKDQMW